MSAQKVDPQVVLDSFVKLLAREAASFVKSNQDDATALGEDVVKAILAVCVRDHMPVITPAGETLESVMLREELLQARSVAFQLIEKAERENAERVARVRANAVGVAGKIAASAASLLAGVAVKVLLGV